MGKGDASDIFVYASHIIADFWLLIDSLDNPSATEILSWCNLTGNTMSNWEMETLLIMIKKYKEYKPIAEKRDELSPLMSDKEKQAYINLITRQHIHKTSREKTMGR